MCNYLKQNIKICFRWLPKPKNEYVTNVENTGRNNELATTASLLLYDLKKKRVINYLLKVLKILF